MKSFALHNQVFINFCCTL